MSGSSGRLLTCICAAVITLVLTLNAETLRAQPSDVEMSTVRELILADLREALQINDVNSAFENLAARRAKRWTEINRDIGKSLLGLRERREAISTQTQFGILIREHALDLKPLKIEGDGQALHVNSAGRTTYFSNSGRRLFNAFKNWRGRKLVWSAHSLNEFIKVIEYSTTGALITPLDTRRLMLVALAYVEALSHEIIHGLRQVISECPLVLQTLRKHGRVFLTSTRYAQGRAAYVYRALAQVRSLGGDPECAAELGGDLAT